ncbi:MAG: aminoacyl-tRNA hydrolase [Chloroflexota bacterium]
MNHIGRALVVGLGNPGKRYREHRHNIGFMAIDRMAQRADESSPRVHFNAVVYDTRIEGMRVLLAKPQTFMNTSGNSVQSLVRFYRIPLDRILVIYDDLDIPFGALRIRSSGGSGGHKGMRSIIDRLSSQDISRMRLGIGRPPDAVDPSDYVLQKFRRSELDELDSLLDQAASAIEQFVCCGVESSMNRSNISG